MIGYHFVTFYNSFFSQHFQQQQQQQQQHHQQQQQQQQQHHQQQQQQQQQQQKVNKVPYHVSCNEDCFICAISRIIKGGTLLTVGYTIFGNKSYSYKMYS